MKKKLIVTLALVIVIIAYEIIHVASKYIPEYQRPTGKLFFSDSNSVKHTYSIKFLPTSKNIDNVINTDIPKAYLKLDEYEDLLCSSAFQNQILATGIRPSGETDILLIRGKSYKILYSSKEEIETPRMINEKNLFFVVENKTGEFTSVHKLVKYALKEKREEVLDDNIVDFGGYSLFQNEEILYSKETAEGQTIMKIDSSGKVRKICEGEAPCCMKDGKSFLFINGINLIRRSNEINTVLIKNIDILGYLTLSPDERYVAYIGYGNMDLAEVTVKITSLKYGWTVRRFKNIDPGGSIIWAEK